MAAVARRALELGHVNRHLARARRQAAVVVAGAVSLPLGGAPVALGPDEVVGLRLEQAVQGVLDRLPGQFAQIGPEALFIQCYDGFWHGNLRYASCLDNLNHTEAGRAFPSIWTLFRCQSAQNIVRYLLLSTVREAAPYTNIRHAISTENTIGPAIQPRRKGDHGLGDGHGFSWRYHLSRFAVPLTAV